MAPALDQSSMFTLPTFRLECGTTLRSVNVAYKTWGTLNSERDNVMVICHPFTGSADVDKWSVRSFIQSSMHMSHYVQVGSTLWLRKSLRPHAFLHFLRKCFGVALWDHL